MTDTDLTYAGLVEYITNTNRWTYTAPFTVDTLTSAVFEQVHKSEFTGEAYNIAEERKQIIGDEPEAGVYAAQNAACAVGRLAGDAPEDVKDSLAASVRKACKKQANEHRKHQLQQERMEHRTRDRTLEPF